MTYAVIHYSINWVYDGVYVKYFRTLKAAEDYLFAFKGSSTHKSDTAYIVKILSNHKIGVIDETDSKKIYGFKPSVKAKGGIMTGDM